MILKVLFIITVLSYLKNDKFQVKNVGYLIAKLNMILASQILPEQYFLSPNMYPCHPSFYM